MKTKLIIPLLLVLAGCNAVQNVVQKARDLFVPNKNVTKIEVEENYNVIAPPAIENDKVVQFSPKERLLALIEHFNRSQDNSTLAITIDEFNKQKQLFGTVKDQALVTVLNGSILGVQEKNRNTIQLLVQLHGILVGENLKFLRTILARGFDYDPVTTANLLIKFEQDKNCSIVTELPDELQKDEQAYFLDNRLNMVAPARLVTGQSPLFTPFLDTCVSQLRLALTKETAPVQTPSTDMATDNSSPTSP